MTTCTLNFSILELWGTTIILFKLKIPRSLTFVSSWLLKLDEELLLSKSEQLSISELTVSELAMSELIVNELDMLDFMSTLSSQGAGCKSPVTVTVGRGSADCTGDVLFTAWIVKFLLNGFCLSSQYLLSSLMLGVASGLLKASVLNVSGISLEDFLLSRAGLTTILLLSSEGRSLVSELWVHLVSKLWLADMGRVFWSGVSSLMLFRDRVSSFVRLEEETASEP